MKLRNIVTLSLILITTLPAFSSGFGLYEQGVQGQGNAGAFVARAEDGSAVYYNPAGLANSRFSELALSGKFVSSQSYYGNAGQSSWESELVSDVLPSLFYNNRWGRFGIALAHTVTNDYELDWDDPEFPGRFLSTGTRFRVEEQLLGLGVKLGGNFSIGATIRNASLEYETSNILVRPLDPAVPSLSYEVEQTFDFDDEDTGFIVGLQYYKSRRFSMGASYQSAIELTSLEGTRTFELITPLDDQRAQSAFASTYANTTANTVFELPERIQVGFATRITVRTRIEVDVSQESWSSREVDVVNSFNAAGEPVVFTTTRDWDDTFTYRLAGDFQHKNALLWRIGLAGVDGAVPTSTFNPDFPDHDRFMYTFGVSYTLRKKYTLEAAWNLIQSRDRKATGKELEYDPTAPDYLSNNNQEGIFETSRLQFQLGAKIRFGKEK